MAILSCNTTGNSCQHILLLPISVSLCLTLSTQHTVSSTECSRWSELTAAMKFHAQVAELAHAPTEFRLLNGSAPVVIGRGDDNGQNLSLLNALLDKVTEFPPLLQLKNRFPESRRRHPALSPHQRSHCSNPSHGRTLAKQWTEGCGGGGHRWREQ
jgi:hypothetical protein